MLVPGIDVPFHSTVLRDGVPDFRELLDQLAARRKLTRRSWSGATS